MMKRTAILAAASVTGGLVVFGLLLLLLSDDFDAQRVPAVSGQRTDSAPSVHALDTGRSEGATKTPSAKEAVLGEIGEAKKSPEVALIDQAQEELARQIDSSLDGVIYVNQLLEQVLAFAELPIDASVDFDYEDKDQVAYRILGTPLGTEAHFLVGVEPFVRDDREFRSFHIEIQMDAGNEEFNRSAMRDGPRISLTLDHGEDGTPGCLAFMTERKVSLASSRRSGIDAHSGQFTSGASYGVHLNDPQNPDTHTFGIVDGNYAKQESFGGVSPLRGDLELVERLHRLFLRNFDSVRSQGR